MKKHNHKGRPSWKLVYANQWGKGYKCKKCEYNKTHLTEKGKKKRQEYVDKCLNKWSIGLSSFMLKRVSIVDLLKKTMADKQS